MVIKRYFLSTHFIENGHPAPLDLITIALVGEDGRELYLGNSECDFSAASDYVWDNVLDPLGFKPLDPTLPVVGDDASGFGFWRTREQLEIALTEFFVPDIEAGDDIEIWSFYAATHWAAFYGLFGRLVDLPLGMPVSCYDLRQWHMHLDNPQCIAQGNMNHDSLNNARWILGAWKELKKVEQRRTGEYRKAQAPGVYPITLVQDLAQYLTGLLEDDPSLGDGLFRASSPADPAIVARDDVPWRFNGGRRSLTLTDVLNGWAARHGCTIWAHHENDGENPGRIVGYHGKRGATVEIDGDPSDCYGFDQSSMSARDIEIRQLWNDAHFGYKRLLVDMSRRIDVLIDLMARGLPTKPSSMSLPGVLAELVEANAFLEILSDLRGMGSNADKD
jgi:hypothetical protein